MIHVKRHVDVDLNGLEPREFGFRLGLLDFLIYSARAFLADVSSSNLSKVSQPS